MRGGTLGSPAADHASSSEPSHADVRPGPIGSCSIISPSCGTIDGAVSISLGELLDQILQAREVCWSLSVAVHINDKQRWSAEK
jgi:hypothetical protein